MMSHTLRTRWIVLIPAAVAGFVGGAELAASPLGMLGVLGLLFLVVFSGTLASSVLSGATEAAQSAATNGLRKSYSEARQVRHEPIYESP